MDSIAREVRDIRLDSDEDDPLPSTSAAVPSGQLPRAPPEYKPSGLQFRTFSDAANDTVIHYQLLDLGRQLYIWMGAGATDMSHLHCAIQVPQSPIPAVTALIKGHGDAEGASLAQRLSRRLGRPVLVSCNLPTSAPIIFAMAERRILLEVQQLGARPQG